MPEQGAFRQVDEKHVSAEVDLMVWSPKFDLVALSNVQGEVILHRLSWQKVWTLPPLSEAVKVKAMSWRSDGKVLAVGYATGQVNLCYIENAEVLHSFTVKGEVTCLSWVCQLLPKGQTWSSDPYPEDNSDLYLPMLQPLNKSYGTLSKGIVDDQVEDKKKLKEQHELNVLITGCSSQQLHLYIYGVFPVATVNIGEQNGSEPRKIHSAILSSDLNSLVVFLELGKEGCSDLGYSLVTFDTKLLSSRNKELRMLALKYGQVATLVDYLQNTIQQMTEAWEDILLEMDSKLYNFAEQKQKTDTGTVSNDFLELLLFGTPSPELQTFLLHDLTDKGLKKLGHSIETSYSNIQKLVVKHLQTVSQAILYHISELKGMSRSYEKFGILGLDQKSLHEAVMTAGSFVLKTSELQQVIDGSIKNFKAFFRWLYVVILRLSPDKPPPELSKMTQHDINFVAEFLRDSFAQFTPKEEEESIADLRAVSPTDKTPGFKLEKVGQYLKKEDLHYPPDISGNPWIQFCRASHTLKDSTVLYPVENNKSLVQLQESLENVITNSLTKPAKKIGQSVEPVSSLYLFSCPKCDDDGKTFIPRVTQFTIGEPSHLYTVFTSDVLPAERFFILRQPTDCHNLTGNIQISSVKFGVISQPEADTSVGSIGSHSGRCENHRVLDVSFYDDKHLSVLLVEDTEDRTPILVQMPFSLVADSNYINLCSTVGVNVSTDIPILDVGPLLEQSQFRRLDNMKAHCFAVSGSRHTATVLFSSRRRVRIFLMDAEEEDEDEDELADVSNQSEADVNQSAASMTVDCGTEKMEEGNEDKENTSVIRDSADNLLT